NSEFLINKDFSSEEINNVSKLLSKALKYCQNNEVELSRNLLISNFDLDLITSLRVIALYGKKFMLPEQISKKETKSLDQISRSTIKYIKEVNESPTVDELMINLDLNIRDASVIYAFINKISADSLTENFEKLSEKELLSIDSISCDILKIENGKRKNNTLIDYAYQLNTGIYSAKRALSYISWCEKFYDITYIENLSANYKKTIIHEKIKAALKYTKENDLKYFLRKVANIDYIYFEEFAPDQTLLKKYRAKEVNWTQYEEEYLNHIKKSNIWKDLDINIFQNACLLCSESSPKKCHRRLLAEFIVNKYKGESFQILHL
ncbi:hypothetical protein LCGC14_3014610, partial [marine sediment metagenome]